MKRFLTVLGVIVVIATLFVVPVSAADSLNPPSAYDSYSDYEDYVQELLDEGLITQKGADALLEEYNAEVDSGYGYGWGGCWRYRGGCGGGYGRMGYRYR